MKNILSLLFISISLIANEKLTHDLPMTLDLDDQAYRQVVVDREQDQYLGHPTTCLLEDGKTILCVYPKGHGRGEIVYKKKY